MSDNERTPELMARAEPVLFEGKCPKDIIDHCCSAPGNVAETRFESRLGAISARTRLMLGIPILYNDAKATSTTEGDIVIHRASWGEGKHSEITMLYPSRRPFGSESPSSPESTEEDTDVPMEVATDETSQIPPVSEEFERTKHAILTINYDVDPEVIRYRVGQVVGFCCTRPDRVVFFDYPTAAIGMVIQDHAIKCLAACPAYQYFPIIKNVMVIRSQLWKDDECSRIVFVQKHLWASVVTSLSKEVVARLQAEADKMVADCIAIPGHVVEAGYYTLDARTVVSRRVCWRLDGTDDIRIGWTGGGEHGIRISCEGWPSDVVSRIILTHDSQKLGPEGIPLPQN